MEDRKWQKDTRLVVERWGGGQSAKIRADTRMLIGPAKITLRLFLAITQLLQQKVIKVLGF